MNPIKILPAAIAAIAFIVVLVVLSAAFIVSETQQAVVTQFGRPVRVIAAESPFANHEQLRQNLENYRDETGSLIPLSIGAGLYFKLPFIQNVEFFDGLALEYDSSPAPITTRDKKRMIVDNFARWYIYDPLLFRQRVITMPSAHARLDNIIFSTIRGRLAEFDFIEIVRSTNNLLDDTESSVPPQKQIPIHTGRVALMEEVTRISRQRALEFGIFILDVRIKRADIPTEVQEAVFENMRAERERIAKRYREEGNRDAAIIRAETDRTVQTMLAQARRQEQVIRGEADAEAARVYAHGFIREVTGAQSEQIQGFASNPEFFQFLRAMETLENSLDEKTSFILNPDNELLRFLQQPHRRMDEERPRFSPAEPSPAQFQTRLPQE